MTNNDPGNEFWKTEDDAVRDEFAAIFGSEDDPADDDNEFGDPPDMITYPVPIDWPDCEI